MASNVWDCDCGFIDSQDPTGSTFTNFLAVDFTSISQNELDEIFIPATYKLHKNDAPFERHFSAEQLQLSEDGLHITVLPASSQNHVPCGQIFSRARTFFYGSYHARIRLTDVPGTVTAFFNYKADDSEIDMEYVSAWAEPTLLYTVKPQIYTDRGNPENSTYARQPLSDASAPSKRSVSEWSFVWVEDIVHFGIGNEYSHNITTNVPSAPGRLALNQWSDGNANYSLGPPREPSTTTVTSLWAVYNMTESSSLVCEKSTSACTVTDGLFQPSSGSGGNSGPDDGPVIDINNAGGYISASSVPEPAVLHWSLALMFCYLLLYRRLL
ncbi:hypothetical protein NLU13_8401 [Sarocladium strictum]|uniref:GH16 domain-containing protein n=1 Tax=Sarocladium strictum TaxID=5046 RepID=A0AA39GCS3_SARSR|nr:hypothetical protein NLU13_8401 [Sarocladium strictum]